MMSEARQRAAAGHDLRALEGRTHANEVRLASLAASDEHRGVLHFGV
jgi:hypothetical protein